MKILKILSCVVLGIIAAPFILTALVLLIAGQFALTKLGIFAAAVGTPIGMYLTGSTVAASAGIGILGGIAAAVVSGVLAVILACIVGFIGLIIAFISVGIVGKTSRVQASLDETIKNNLSKSQRKKFDAIIEKMNS